jgi:hypothetical protein
MPGFCWQMLLKYRRNKTCPLKYFENLNVNIGHCRLLVIWFVHRKLTKSSLLHTVLCEYLRHCSKEDYGEVLLQIQSSLLDFTNTRDGAHVAIMCIWRASNKVC